MTSASPTSAPAATSRGRTGRPTSPCRARRPARRLGFRHGSAFQAGDGRLDAAFHHALALDDALGDIARHLVGDRFHVGRFGEHDAADARVPEEAIGAAVAPHGDMADGVDPQPRLQAGRDGEVENVHVGGHVGEDRRQFGGQQDRAACDAPRACRPRRRRGRRRRSSRRGWHRTIFATDRSG